MPLERYPFETLSKDGQLMAYRHNDFWQPMDVIREKVLSLWKSGKALGKIDDWNKTFGIIKMS